MPVGLLYYKASEAGSDVQTGVSIIGSYGVYHTRNNTIKMFTTGNQDANGLILAHEVGHLVTGAGRPRLSDCTWSQILESEAAAWRWAIKRRCRGIQGRNGRRLQEWERNAIRIAMKSYVAGYVPRDVRVRLRNRLDPLTLVRILTEQVNNLS